MTNSHYYFSRGDVTFLYQLTEGVCPKSYGMNVALMAGIDAKIVKRAQDIAEEFEKSTKGETININEEFKQLCKLMNSENTQNDDINDIWLKLKQ